MGEKKIIQGLPLFLLTIISLYSLINGLITGKPFTWHLYTGIISIFICLVIYIIKYRWYKYFFIIVLTIGSINIFHFTFNVVTISFSLSVFRIININTIEIQLLSLILLLLFVIINIKRIIMMMRELLLSNDS